MIIGKNEVLRRIGLSEKEIAVYVSLLEHGPGTVMAIAKNSGLHRPVIYRTIPELEKKGLVSRIPRGKRVVFSVESPEKLNLLLDETTKGLSELLPELETSYNAQGNKPIIKFLEGRKGILSAFGDIPASLKSGDVYYRYSPVEDLKKIRSYMLPSFRKMRAQKKLETVIISNSKEDLQPDERFDRAIKNAPGGVDAFNFNLTETIYGKKVSIIDFNSETAVIIENEKIAEFQRKIFKLLYSKL